MKRLQVVIAILIALSFCVPATMGFAASTAGAKAKASTALSKKVDVNSATKDQLMTIPSIGKVTEENILSFKKKNGEFKKLDDLLNVKGIGEKTLKKISEHLTV